MVEGADGPSSREVGLGGPCEREGRVEASGHSRGARSRLGVPAAPSPRAGSGRGPGRAGAAGAGGPSAGVKELGT